jgi:RNA methyltransferase, TrmH family
MREIITSGFNPSIKYLRSLYNTKKRRNEGKYILEGYRIINEAIESQVDFDSIYFTPGFYKSDKGNHIINKIDDTVYINVIDKRVLEEIADTVNPQGIIAIANEIKYDMVSFLENASTILVLDRIQDPGNMGTIIRTSVAAGVDGIISLKGSVDIYNLKVLRASMGAIFNIAVFSGIDFDSFWNIIEKYRNKYRLISTDPGGDKFYFEEDFTKDIMLVIGNEANGIRKEIIARSDEIIKIPIIGKIDSLNAAVASGIILYELMRNRSYKY